MNINGKLFRISIIEIPKKKGLFKKKKKKRNTFKLLSYP